MILHDSTMKMFNQYYPTTDDLDCSRVILTYVIYQKFKKYCLSATTTATTTTTTATTTTTTAYAIFHL